MIRPLLAALRPGQWIKNLFVGAPLLFAREILDPARFARTAAAFAVFCLLSGAVYLINDLADLERDRAHPRKRLRPIAAGALSAAAAAAAAAGLAGASVLAALAVHPWLGAAAAAYLALNAAYSLRLKRVPFVDVLCIAGGFLLRVAGGGAAAGVPVSGWLLSCTALLAAFLGFGKRAHESAFSGDGGREVLARYPARPLRGALYALAAVTVLVYALYTRAPHTLAFFGTGRLILTVPFVAFGVGRFLWIVHRRPAAESPTSEMLRDAPTLINLAAWTAAVAAIVYAR